MIKEMIEWFKSKYALLRFFLKKKDSSKEIRESVADQMYEELFGNTPIEKPTYKRIAYLGEFQGGRVRPKGNYIETLDYVNSVLPLCSDRGE